MGMGSPQSMGDNSNYKLGPGVSLSLINSQNKYNTVDSVETLANTVSVRYATAQHYNYYADVFILIEAIENYEDLE